MNPTDRYLDILGVRRGVSRDDLKTAYRALIRISHPDRFHDDEALKKKAEEQTKLLNEAYQYLLTNLEQLTAPGADTSRPAETPASEGRGTKKKKTPGRRISEA